MLLIFSMIFATRVAYAFTFAIDILAGELTGVYQVSQQSSSGHWNRLQPLVGSLDQDVNS
jgi:hypothetical protein